MSNRVHNHRSVISYDIHHAQDSLESSICLRDLNFPELLRFLLLLELECEACTEEGCSQSRDCGKVVGFKKGQDDPPDDCLCFMK